MTRRRPGEGRPSPTGDRIPHGRVLFLIRSLDVGGAQRQLIELASGLQRANWQVKVLSFYGGGELEADLLKRGVVLEALGKSGRWDVIGFSFRLVRSLRRERPDVLHSYQGIPNLFGAALRPFVPGMRVVWGVRDSNMDLEVYGWVARLSFRMGCWLSRFADLVICNSTAGREFHVARGYPSDRMIVIPNGIDCERFRPDHAARSAIRQRWAIGDEHLLVGLTARFDPMKDHDTFLRAAAIVIGTRPEVRFVCVGDGPEPYRARLMELASDLGLDGRLIWAGPRIDMPDVYNALDLAVLSSRWGEGFPNVVAEAMATGVPCVVTDVGDSRSVVGDTGWVCPPRDPAELARAMIAATTSRWNLTAHGERARQRVRTEFSKERLTSTTMLRLAQLVDGGT